ncbi:MAG: DUF962 domain-containing protein [Myxococcales bacterium]|nr:DUF962 domain-containing protein [Myxococcales bacterium]
MSLIQLNQEWTDLLEKYRADHQDPRNQACHAVGIPLIAGSLPVGATIVGLPLAAAMFTVGWTFQFVGHAFEGKKPSFVEDRRQLVVGAIWWLKKVGIHIVKEAPAASA